MQNTIFFNTPFQDHRVEMKQLDGRSARKLKRRQRIFDFVMGLNSPASKTLEQRWNSIENRGLAQRWQDFLVIFFIASIDGDKEHILKRALNLPFEDYNSIRVRINRYIFNCFKGSVIFETTA